MAIAAGAFEPFYVRIFVSDRASLGALFTGLPYRKLPGMREFLLGVRERTRDGDAIALAAPLHRAPQWSGGYDYLYERSMYLLAGRQVVPLIAEGDVPQPQNLARATYLACFHCDGAQSGFAVVWRGPDGVLLRRAP